MNTTALLLAAFFALAPACNAHGADAAVPVEVTQVKTAGYWQAASGKEGTYRAVIVQDGWEHVWSRLRVEWIARPSSRDGIFEVVATVVPPLPIAEGTANLQVRVTPRPGVGLHITVIASQNMPPFARSRYELLATSPGQVQILNPKRRK